MTTLRIEGQRPLSGQIAVSGSKNAATKILVACLLTRQPCRIRNVPEIEDVRRILELLEGIGAKISWSNPHQVDIVAEEIHPENIDVDAVRKLRASILLMGALVARCGRIELPGPGGDQIGARPLDTHLTAFQGIGIDVSQSNGNYILQDGSRQDVEVTLPEMSVTATENLMLASVIGSHTVVVHCAAADPSVQDLGWFLISLGAKIEGIGTHTLTIHGIPELHGSAGYDVMPDPVETGTFICLAAASRSTLGITGAAPEFLRSELLKFSEVGVRYQLTNIRPANHGHYQLADIQVQPSNELKAIRAVHNMPYPGFNPDLLPPFTVLLTQASGTSLVHDWMYENRLKYVEELNKMGADIFIADPHRILVTGPRALFGSQITNYDIRTGASLLVASLIASGTSRLAPVYQLDRGYEKIDERLNALGASVHREEA